MHRFSVYFIAALFFLSSTYNNLSAQQMPPDMTTDPYKAVFVYDDIHNFINAMDLFSEEGDSAAILQKEYLDKGTQGLKTYISKYGLTSEMLLAAVKKHPEKYNSLGEMPAMLKDYSDSSYAAYAELKNYIPDIVYPRTYFLIGAHRGIASASEAGQLISVDRWATPIKNKTTVLVHELTHFQQAMTVGPQKYGALYGPEKNLLGLCLREGTAEFFASLVTNRITQQKAAEYLDINEEDLWERFSKDMHGADTKDWMWGESKDPDQPNHIGYALGCRIAESYYNRSENKEQALKEILAATDYMAFLEKSGYGQKFGK